MVEFLLDGDFSKVRTIKRLLRFHHFKPSFDSFLYICEGLFAGFSLRQASRKCGNLGYKIPRLIFLDNYVQFHIISFVLKISQALFGCKFNGVNAKHTARYLLCPAQSRYLKRHVMKKKILKLPLPRPRRS